MRIRDLVTGGVCALVVGLLVASAIPALGNNFGSAGTPGIGVNDNGVWLTNNANWNVGRRALAQFFSSGVTAAVNQEFDPTDLAANIDTPSGCPDSTYDVCAFDSDYGNTEWVGVNQCAGSTSGSHPNQECSLAFVKYNTRYSVNSAKSLACEELGHSVGLRHRFTDPDSCMSQIGEDLIPHDKGHIDDTY